MQKLEGQISGLTVQVHLSGGSWLDVGVGDVPGPPLQAEVVRGLFVLFTSQIELKVLLTELRTQKCSEDRHSRVTLQQGIEGLSPLVELLSADSLLTVAHLAPLTHKEKTGPPVGDTFFHFRQIGV